MHPTAQTTRATLVLVSAFLLSACAGAGKSGDTGTSGIGDSPNEAGIAVPSTPPTTARLLRDAVDTLSTDILRTLPTETSLRVAVMPITDLEGGESTLGLYLTDQLTTSLTGARIEVEIVERAKLNDVLREFKIGSSGILSQETLQKLGRALGADAAVVGTITDLGSDVDATIRLIEVETLKVLTKARALISKSEKIADMMGQTIGAGHRADSGSAQPQWDESKAVYLSDLTPVRTKMPPGSPPFYEPMPVGVDRFADKYDIVLSNQVHRKGLFTHAPAIVTYDLKNKYFLFVADIGLWDCGNPLRGIQGQFAGKNGSVNFQVWVDGAKKYESGILGWDDCEHLEVAVTGARTMDIVVEQGIDNNSYDWAVWGSARLIRK